MKGCIAGMPRLETVCSLSRAEGREKEYVPWERCAGRVSAEYAYLYPPGIPLAVPGERLTEEAAESLCWYMRQGYSVEGLKRERYIEVLINE